MGSIDSSESDDASTMLFRIWAVLLGNMSASIDFSSTTIVERVWTFKEFRCRRLCYNRWNSAERLSYRNLHRNRCNLLNAEVEYRNIVKRDEATYKRTSGLSCFNVNAYRLDSNAACRRFSSEPGSCANCPGCWVSAYWSRALLYARSNEVGNFFKASS